MAALRRLPAKFPLLLRHDYLETLSLSAQRALSLMHGV
jgi:hypothetical protein